MFFSRQLLAEKEQDFRAQLNRSNPALLREFPVTSYVTKLTRTDPYYQYEAFPVVILRRAAKIRSRYGQNAVAMYQKISLCRLMSEALERNRIGELPETIQQVAMSWFNRIVDDFEKLPDTYYDFDRPLWPLRKDLGVCSGRAIPIGGAWIVEARLIARQRMIGRAGKNMDAESRAAQSRWQEALSKLLYRLHLGPAIRATRRMSLRLQGPLDTCYVIHTIERNIQDMNAEQMEIAYQNIASLLRKNAHVWGVYRSSWFLDPAVSEISPELGFFSQVPINHNAELYCAGRCSSDDTQKATMMSLARTRLYEQGKYVPKSYFYFWPRASVIRAFDTR